MQIKLGAKAYSSDDKVVGTVSHIVIYPGTKDVTHFVVQKGNLFTNDRVVPVDEVFSSDDKHVVLRKTALDLDQIPELEPTQYNQTELEGPMNDAPPTTTTRNIPEGAVALKEGAQVITSDGHAIGHVERIYTASGENRATFIQSAKGQLIGSKKKMLPTELISSVMENEVRLAVDSDFLNNMPEQQPDAQQMGSA
jgi:uncharacterized protein YrrD